MNNKILPISDAKNEILNSVNMNDVTIISAETGSGKSTQVPQWLFQNNYSVIVTEPRRIAAITVANRVSEEMGELGNVVAFQTAFESTKNKNTKILFCTDGLQMAKNVVSDQEFAEKHASTGNRTVLVIDEVHEWNLNIETLVAWSKIILKQQKSQIKLVLMSATMDCEHIFNFFNKSGIRTHIVKVGGRNFYVDRKFCHKDALMEEIMHQVAIRHNTLVFLPGKREIEESMQEFNERALQIGLNNCIALPLHGELSSGEQRQCFSSVTGADGNLLTKVIFATNIAQTSVTIDDVDAVVDSGLEKRIEIISGIESLVLHDISKSDMDQRAGRAGRVKNGVYILCSDTPMEKRDESSKPEIQRLTLERVILKLQTIGLDINDMEFLHQPDEKAVAMANKMLVDLGALISSNNNGKNTLSITAIGREMAALPVSARYARILIEARKLDVLSEAVKLVSILESGTMINHKMVNYVNFTYEYDSDLLAELDIFNQISDRRFEDLKNNGINAKNFFRAKELVHKLNTLLGISVNMQRSEIHGDLCKHNCMLKSIYAGFADRLFLNIYREVHDETDRELSMDKNSCVMSKLIVGEPITINFTDRYGFKRTMDLVKNVTAVKFDASNGLDFKLVNGYLGNKIKTALDIENAEYYEEDSSFVVTKTLSLFDFTLDRDEINVKPGDEFYDVLMKKHLERVDEEKQKIAAEIARQEKMTILVNGNKYQIKEDCFGYKYVELSDNDLMSDDFAAFDEDEIKFDDETVEIRLLYDRVRKISLAKRLVAHEHIKQWKNDILQSLPGRTGNIDRIKEYLDKTGRYVAINEFDGSEVEIWIGLESVNNGVEFGAFNLESYAAMYTDEALKNVFINHAKTMFGHKLFMIRAGKKVTEDERSAKAMSDFQEYVDILVEDINAHNFSDSLDNLNNLYLDVVRENHIDKILAYPKIAS